MPIGDRQTNGVLWDSRPCKTLHTALQCLGIFMEPTDALEKAGLQQSLLDFSPDAQGAGSWQRWSGLEPFVVLLDWFQKQETLGFAHQLGELQ